MTRLTAWITGVCLGFGFPGGVAKGGRNVGFGYQVRCHNMGISCKCEGNGYYPGSDGSFVVNASLIVSGNFKLV